ncbi:MAG: hypothetical protein ACE5HO_21310 [bacterium]
MRRRQSIPYSLDLKYNLTAIITHCLPLSQGVEGYRIFDRKLQGCTKVVVQVDRCREY